jgi:hypothetical protein
VAGKYEAAKFTTTPFAQFGHRHAVAPVSPMAQLTWYFFYICPEIADFCHQKISQLLGIISRVRLRWQHIAALNFI